MFDIHALWVIGIQDWSPAPCSVFPYVNCKSSAYFCLQTTAIYLYTVTNSYHTPTFCKACTCTRSAMHETAPIRCTKQHQFSRSHCQGLPFIAYAHNIVFCWNYCNEAMTCHLSKHAHNTTYVAHINDEAHVCANNSHKKPT